jgi:hypothetical protein
MPGRRRKPTTNVSVEVAAAIQMESANGDAMQQSYHPMENTMSARHAARARDRLQAKSKATTMADQTYAATRRTTPATLAANRHARPCEAAKSQASVRTFPYPKWSKAERFQALPRGPFAHRV